MDCARLLRDWDTGVKIAGRASSDTMCHSGSSPNDFALFPQKLLKNLSTAIVTRPLVSYLPRFLAICTTLGLPGWIPFRVPS